jgi:hypothetical protein
MASEDLINLSLHGGVEEGFVFEFDEEEDKTVDLKVSCREISL